MKKPNKPQSIEQQIKRRIHGIYGGFVKRHGAKYWKSGRRKGMLRQPAVPIPFTEAELLRWIYFQPTIAPGVMECRYCKCWLTALDVSPDHYIPLSRGGGLGLDNLVPCCKPCNAYKGAITGSGYMILLTALNTMDPEDRKDALQRLKSGGFRWMQKKTDNGAKA